MSKIGKRPISIPDKTTVEINDGVVTVKGPKGTLTRTLRPEVSVTVAEKEVTLVPKGSSKFARMLWGTYASHIQNMVQGVTTPFVKKLIIEGIGYRVELAGTNLNFTLGFSHPVKVAIPQGITVAVDKNIMTISGIDKEQVGLFASKIRMLKKPEPYKGKGIRYDNEVVRRKQGKKSVA